MKYLLDTNVVSEIQKKKSTSQVAVWFSIVHSSQLHLSCITGEIRKEISKLAKKDKIASLKLEKWLERIIIDYNERILNIDKEICEEWGELMSIDSTNAIDALIAAQAKQSNMILVTRNIKHYNMFNIKIFDPFN
ncbi:MULTISPECIES: type II toxin-antitoxin system VapC family toxin [spotted fever group]|uniref:PIN domain protein n=2 Tax=spotted fever group TaxID=114277 RepID=A0A0F3PD25_RICRH|nr:MULTISPECIES: type II toxin-antitoxin system VapC family toxin [spotted fever group]AFB32117.1 toxin of toxin-antitoxin [Rickettsia massiliae str. AZT80]KJV78193.1 PIN domain protein [Rickettsia rhipicephali str. Ect]